MADSLAAGLTLRWDFSACWNMNVLPSTRCLYDLDIVPGFLCSPEVLGHQQILWYQIPPFWLILETPLCKHFHSQTEGSQRFALIVSGFCYKEYQSAEADKDSISQLIFIGICSSVLGFFCPTLSAGAEDSLLRKLSWQTVYCELRKTFRNFNTKSFLPYWISNPISFSFLYFY